MKNSTDKDILLDMSAEEPRSAARKRPTGRRTGDSGTREAILDAALGLFAAGGYDATSIRAVASRAGVDPGLIRYFYGTKQELFVTTMAQRTVIPDRIAEALSCDPDTVGRRLTDTYLGLWEDEETRPILLGLFRSAMTTRGAANMLVETLSARVRGDAPLPAPDSPRDLDFALAATHLLGVAIARHLIKLPVVVDLTHEQLVDLLAPEIQRDLGDRPAQHLSAQKSSRQSSQREVRHE